MKSLLKLCIEKCRMRFLRLCCCFSVDYAGGSPEHTGKHEALTHCGEISFMVDVFLVWFGFQVKERKRPINGVQPTKGALHGRRGRERRI